jgi:predicted nucleic acid-binding protein
VAVVVDASVLVVLVVDDPRAPSASLLMEGWLDAGETIHAPALAPYEVASALTRLVDGGLLPAARLGEAWAGLMTLPVDYHRINDDGERVVRIALELGRRSAYDAAYLALAQDLDADFWTLDGSLARNAGSSAHRVRLVEPPASG